MSTVTPGVPAGRDRSSGPAAARSQAFDGGAASAAAVAAAHTAAATVRLSMIWRMAPSARPAKISLLANRASEFHGGARVDHAAGAALRRFPAYGNIASAVMA